MPTAKKQNFITEQEYLDGELISDIRHEYVEGEVYAMVGAKYAHNAIAGNLFGEIRSYLKGKPCQPFASDMKVKVGNNYYYPDVLVDCSDFESDDQFSEAPKLIIEVLSESTRSKDVSSKFFAYRQLPSLEEYVLVEQSVVKIEVFRKADNWQPVHYMLEDTVELKSIGLSLPIEEIYDRVTTPDMEEWESRNAANEEA